MLRAKIRVLAWEGYKEGHSDGQTESASAFMGDCLINYRFSKAVVGIPFEEMNASIGVSVIAKTGRKWRPRIVGQLEEIFGEEPVKETSDENGMFPVNYD